MKKGKTPLFCNKKAIIPIFFVSILWFLYGGKRWIRIRARASVLARIAKRPAPKGGSWRNAPRGVNRAESTIPSIKKRHRDFSKEVDSLGVGQFSNIQQNAALCSAMLSKVHNGAVAICNGANRGLRTRYLIHSLSQKKAVSRLRYCFFWWEEVDSNHRRRCQQIYSLLPLATRESSHAWSWWSESNQQPADYKSAALPLSHTSEVFGTNTLCRTIRIKMVPWGGVEPPTQGFSVPCSTN